LLDDSDDHGTRRVRHDIHRAAIKQESKMFDDFASDRSIDTILAPDSQ
jgi:hypothetical protein